MKRSAFLYSAIMLILLFSISTSILATPQKKKIYIYDIKARSGLSKSQAKKITDYMTISIIENYNEQYQIVSEDDIRIMYKKAAELQLSGCNDQGCITEIADAIDADEIIYGEITTEKKKLHISVNNLARNRETLQLTKKSIVNIDFYEGQSEWFSKEILKKLLDPAYIIEPDNAPGSIGGLRYRNIKNELDIDTMKFIRSEKYISRLFEYFSEIVEEGDGLHKEGKTEKAKEKYEEVMSKINEKLREENRRKAVKFSAIVCDRIVSIYEEEGDRYYNEYNFREAIKGYKDGLNVIDNYRMNSVSKKEYILRKKISTTKETGSSWLENRVYSLCDQAEYLNVRGKTSQAKAIIQKAGWLIEANREFLNDPAQRVYNNSCKIIGFDNKEITSDHTYYSEKKDSHYGITALSFTGITAVGVGLGWFFNVKVSDANSEYDALKTKYILSTDFTGATQLHSDMEDSKDDSQRFALYRSISLGVGLASALTTIWCIYKYHSVKSIERKLNGQYGSVSFYFGPYCSAASCNSSDYKGSAINEYNLGAVVSYRF